MARLRITRLGHGGVLYRSPGDRWVWVDRWSGAPTYVAPPDPWQVDVVAPTHGHFDHVGDDAADVVELAGRGGRVVGSHELSLYLGEKGVEAVGWGWVIRFEDGTTVYHSGDTDLFGDMALVRERWSPTIAVLPIGGHYTMGPADAARALALIGARTVIPVHYATFPILAGTPTELAESTDAEVVSLEPGETWEA
jgi:L-ascorbate metabolism protein UlaG (beta-lactamase superfamily)